MSDNRSCHCFLSKDVGFSQEKKPFSTFIQPQVIWITIRIVTNTTDVLKRLRWSMMNHNLAHFTSLLKRIILKPKLFTFSIRTYDHDSLYYTDIPQPQSVTGFKITFKFTIHHLRKIFLPHETQFLLDLASQMSKSQPLVIPVDAIWGSYQLETVWWTRACWFPDMFKQLRTWYSYFKLWYVVNMMCNFNSVHLQASIPFFF